MASHLTMLWFAERKEVQRDRMISWPRTQNEMMPDPPYVDIPDPSNFGRLRMPNNADLQAIYFDIENMFHNIRLPSSMVKLFPLRPVSFGDLPGNLQRRMETTLRYHPKQKERFRPLQATLSMGFHWGDTLPITLRSPAFAKLTLRLLLPVTEYDWCTESNRFPGHLEWSRWRR